MGELETRLTAAQHAGDDGTCRWHDEEVDRLPVLFDCAECGLLTCECDDSPDDPQKVCCLCWDKKENPEYYA